MLTCDLTEKINGLEHISQIKITFRGNLSQNFVQQSFCGLCRCTVISKVSVKHKNSKVTPTILQQIAILTYHYSCNVAPDIRTDSLELAANEGPQIVVDKFRSLFPPYTRASNSNREPTQK